MCYDPIQKPQVKTDRVCRNIAFLKMAWKSQLKLTAHSEVWQKVESKWASGMPMSTPHQIYNKQ